MAITDASDLARGVKAMRPCLPAKDVATSRASSGALGVTADARGCVLRAMQRGTFGVLRRNDDAKAGADNLVMHGLVDDVRAGWRHLDALDLPPSDGVAPQRPPKAEPWGLTVAHVFDPIGLHWPFGQPTWSHG
jgi:hypothetical protein